MSTINGPAVKKSHEDSLETKVYAIVENLSEYLPIANDRNRLAFNLFTYMKGEGDSPEILVHSNKLTVTGISLDELAGIINKELEKVKV